MGTMCALALPQEWQIGLILGLLVVAVVLFAIEVFSVDVITLLLLLVLMGTGILTPAAAFAGFSEDIIITLGSVFIIGGALQATGALEAIARQLTRIGDANEHLPVFILLLVCSAMSAFMNNTIVTAMMIGPAISLARRRGIAISKVLLPMAFASILGGTCTLIGTSTNLAVSGYIAREKMTPIGLFEITPIGVIIVAIGITYLMLIGRRVLPVRDEERADFVIHDYLSEIVVLPGSPLAGKKSMESDLAQRGFRLIQVVRGTEVLRPDPGLVIHEGDIVLVAGNAETLAQIKMAEGIEIRGRIRLGDQALAASQTQIAEVVLMPNSELVGRSIAAIHREDMGLTILAMRRWGHELGQDIGTVRLETGDLLLVQASREHLKALKTTREIAVLEELGSAVFNRRKGLYAVGIFGAALVAGAFDLAPISVAFLAAAVLILVFRCVTMEQAYEFIDWRLLILIAGMTAFGTAIEQTGAAQFLARNIDGTLAPLGTMGILAGYFALTILLTQPMSNAAAALVVVPIALESARDLGVNERTFAVAIMLAASISFIAPFEPSCILVYGPGRYRFMDFVKSGVLLTLILAVVVLFLIPVFWPLRPR